MNTNIKNNDKWGYLTNCSTFASKIWNSIASGSSKVDAGSINTPASLAKSITKVGEAESYTLLKYNTSVCVQLIVAGLVTMIFRV